MGGPMGGPMGGTMGGAQTHQPFINGGRSRSHSVDHSEISMDLGAPLWYLQFMLSLYHSHSSVLFRRSSFGWFSHT